MPPRRVLRGTGRSYPVRRQAPEIGTETSERAPRQTPDIEIPPEGVSVNGSTGHVQDSGEDAAPRQNNPQPNSQDLEEEDTASSIPVRNNAQDPFEQVCQRLIDRLDQQGHPAPRENSTPSFLEIVATMRTLGTDKFIGGTDPFAADAWIRRLERNLNATRCPEEYKKDVAVNYLDRDASYWWENIEKRRGQNAAEYSWQQFQNEFLKKYFPMEMRDRMEKQYFDLTQQERSVREYEAEFTRLRRYVRNETEDDAEVTRRFMRGLRPDLVSRLQVVACTDLPTFVETAVNVEEALAAERKYLAESRQERQGKNDRSGHGSKNQDNRASGRSSRQPPVCYKCGRKGHRQDACRTPNGNRQDITCWSCGEKGHLAHRCPKGQSTQVGRQDVTCYKCGERGHFANQCPQGLAHQRPRPPTIQGPPKRLAIETAPRQQAPEGRVYALDTNKPESSRQPQGLIAGI